jgi:hypothetical protein
MDPGSRSLRSLGRDDAQRFLRLPLPLREC